MRLFKTNNVEIIRTFQEQFCFKLATDSCPKKLQSCNRNCYMLLPFQWTWNKDSQILLHSYGQSIISVVWFHFSVLLCTLSMLCAFVTQLYRLSLTLQAALLTVKETNFIISYFCVFTSVTEVTFLLLFVRTCQKVVNELFWATRYLEINFWQQSDQFQFQNRNVLPAAKFTRFVRN